MGTISEVTKIKLLLWKNFTLFWRNKRDVSMSMSTIFVLLWMLYVLRKAINTKYVPDVIYKSSLPVKSTIWKGIKPSPEALYLTYSPNTSVAVNNIVREAANSMNMKYVGFLNSKHLELAFKAETHFAGIVFPDSWAGMTKYPEKLTYTLRFPATLRSSIRKTWNTEKLEDLISLSGPRSIDDQYGLYMNEGFIALQNAVSAAFITLSSGQSNWPEIRLQRYPFAAYVKDNFLILGPYTGIFFTTAFTYMLNIIVKDIAHEKEKQLKETMKIMGTPAHTQWISWFIMAFIVSTLVAVVILLVLKIKVNNNSILPHTSFLVMLFFFEACICGLIGFGFFVSVLFDKATTAEFAYMIGILVLESPYLISLNGIRVNSFSAKLLLNILPPTAICYGSAFIFDFERNGEGLQWDNIFNPVRIEDSMSVGLTIVMLLISTILFIALALYIEQISPGEYGIPQVWYFPFTKSYWYGNDAETIVETGNKSKKQNEKPDENFEPEPDDGVVGMQIKHLTKNFGRKVAVNDLTMNLFEGEILVLLGANGAGKTTTISMLTGMCNPTSGTAIINGHDIITDLHGARESLGICPQHDILFDKLTVRDHLYFYGSLKGLKGIDLENNIFKYIIKFQLADKENDLSNTLSGGMKRKLSFIVAIIGGAKVVLCDEPSSGLDPAARRHLWNILKQEKLNRTILLTTHGMDEADFLGDRIAIMKEGNLKCYGTTFFLKRKFGGGYKLVCNKGPGCDVNEVTAFMGRFVPGIHPYSDVGSELTYELPRTYSSVLGNLFRDLEGRSKSLKLDGYGLSGETLEEVFLTVNGKTIVKDKSRRSLHKENTNPVFIDNPLRKGYLRCNQLFAMFLKHFYNVKRSKSHFITQNLVALLIVLFYMPQLLLTTDSGNPPLEISLLKYPKSVIVLESDATTPPNSLVGKTIKAYGNFIKFHGSNHKLIKIYKPFIPYMLHLGTQNQMIVNTQYIAAATIKPDSIIVWLNNEPFHTAPLTLNLVHNALAKAIVGENSAIEVTNHPLPYTKNEMSTYTILLQSKGLLVTFVVTLAMCCISSMYVILPIKEKACRAKLLQFVSGTDAITFWSVQFLCDLLTFLFSVFIIIILLVIIHVDGLSTFTDFAMCFLVLMFSVIGVLPLVYLTSFVTDEPVDGLNYQLSLQLLIAFAGTALVMLETLKIHVGAFEYILILPLASLFSALYNIYEIGLKKRICKQATELILQIPCDLLPECCREVTYFDRQKPSIRREVIYLTVGTIIWITLLLLLEYKCVRKIKEIFGWVFRMSLSWKKEQLEQLDSDVLAERKRIKKMSRTEINSHGLVIDKLTKYYCQYLAVNKISVAVPRGECFGLLGVNGAGKTTTLKMLTRDESISNGRAFVSGINLTRNVKDIYQNLGYCPQFDGIFENLTGRETLTIHSLLNGIRLRDTHKLITYLADSFGFKNYLDIVIRRYSGGNKRKLSAAIAVIGNKTIVLLDEPTCGMDPGSRRQLWDVVSHIRNSGKAIVLTSHSMEESEALCTRLTIMVNGEFKCLGSIQYIKNKFTKGFVLKAKLSNGLNQTSVIAKEIILSTFEGATVKDQQYGLITFYIPKEKITWSDIFNTIEGKKKQLNIEDYTLTQASLEDIFLEFAELQGEEKEKSNYPCC